MEKIKQGLRQLSLVLSTGFVFFYYSEWLFWAHVRSEDTPGNWLTTWLIYSLLAYVFLAVNHYFRIRNIWALFLAGALFGWLVEGVVVQTTYADLPLSLSFTGLAWHALITVWVGWYYVQKQMLMKSAWPTMLSMLIIGCISGLWAICWWIEPGPDGGKAGLFDYSVYMFSATILLILATFVMKRTMQTGFATARWSNILVLGVLLVFFFFNTVPAYPIALLIFPILLGLIYWGLRRSSNDDSVPLIMHQISEPVHALRYLLILVLPSAAVLVYAAADLVNLQWHTNWILYLLTTPAGFVLFGIAWIHCFRKRDIQQT